MSSFETPLAKLQKHPELLTFQTYTEDFIFKVILYLVTEIRS